MVEPFGVDRIMEHEREIRVIKRMILDLEERFRISPGSGDLEEGARLRQDVEALKQLMDQLSSREGVTLHRLETLKERIDEVVAVGQQLEETKRKLANLPKGASFDLPAEAVAALREEFQEVRQGFQEVRQGLEILRAGQAAQAKRLDSLKEENAKLRSEYRQLEAQAHGALDALQQREVRLEERVGNMERSGPVPPPAPRRTAVSKNRLAALRERSAQVADVSDFPDSDGEPGPRRGGKGRARAEADGS